jgi:hypothetical protein
MRNRESSKESSGHAALLVFPTIKEAAATIGIGESTLRRWTTRPDFWRDYDQARHDILHDPTVKLGQAVSDALGCVHPQCRTIIVLSPYGSDADSTKSPTPGFGTKLKFPCENIESPLFRMLHEVLDI